MAKKTKKKGAAKKLAKTKTASRPNVSGKDADLLKRLDNRKGVTGGMWKPTNVGDSIVGDVLAMEASEDSKYGKLQLVATIGTPEGAQRVFGNWSMQQGFMNEMVNVGDRIGIQYKGKERVTRKGRPMNCFAVVREGGPGKKLSDVLTELAESDRKVSKKKKTKKRRR